MKISDCRFQIPNLGFLFLTLAGIAFGWTFYSFVLQPLPRIPSFEKTRAAYVKSEGILLDRNGKVIHELRIHGQGRRLDWIALRNISPALQSAVVVAEDRRFYRHRGVDWLAAGSACAKLLTASQVRGASTITMQLAAMLDSTLRPDLSGRSFFQKLRQVRAARSYEQSWSKPEILEAYLNLVTFRGELQGVSAATRGLFSKEPQGLNHVESIILCALLRSPNAGSRSVAARANALAQALHLTLQHGEVETATRAIFEKPYYIQPQIALAPHIALQLFKDTDPPGGSRAELTCTLEGGLQAFAAESLRRHVISVNSRNMHDGSALVVDNQSGEVLAYVGNIGARSSARYVDGIRAKRQAGSTLKPFVYALAFDQRLLTAASLLEDRPLDIPEPGGVYRPRNYDNHFHGTVTARIALASSLNVPAVQALNLIGVNGFVDSLRQLGFEDVKTPEFYGPSLALGSADVSLWDLVNAYRTIANSGIWSPLQITPCERPGSRRRVVSAEAAFLVSDILSDRESRSWTFDLESPLSTRFWTAVKTGTSKDMRDNWCVGFSDRYTVGVWAGNFSGEPMWNVSGITGAAPVWIEIMNRLHRNDVSRKPQPPAGLVRRLVNIPSVRQSKPEWYLKGTDATLVQHAAGRIVPRIAYPTAGTVVALDPDIPPQDQRVFFEAEPKGASLEWILDGRSLGASAALLPWSPSSGKHMLQLVDGFGKEIDSVNFEVRGN
jgi:penicillin-binding protein 1C